jgi:hypothetical protein
LTSPNGNVYVGNFRDDQPDGTGKLTKKDGSTYEGFFTNSEIIG